MSDARTDTDTSSGRVRRNTLDTDTMQWVSAIAALAGLGLVAYPFMFEATETAVWNDTLVGTAIFVLAGYNFYRMTKNRLASVAVASLAVLLGLWALASPMVIEMGSEELAMATAASGLITVAFSAYDAYANSSADTSERGTAHA